MKNVTAIILGGGRGARLYPLTLERSKPAVAFAGKYRLIDIPISNCINSGMKKIFVLTQFLSASMHRHIMQTYRFDTFTGGFVDILAAEQTAHSADWFQGTSDAVRATMQHTMHYEADQVVILGGDHLYRMDYSKLVQFHRDNNADITLGVHPVARDTASQMGLMNVDGSGRVIDFVEKPQDPQIIDRYRAPTKVFAEQGIQLGEDRYLASMGIYVFEPQVLRDLLQDTSKTDFGREVIPDAIDKCKVMAYPFNDYWRDIGTIQSFFDANLDLVHRNPEFNLYQGGWAFYTRTRNLPPSRVVDSEIRDTIIAEGCSLTGATIINSVVGVRSLVGAGSFLKDVVLMGNDSYEGERKLGNRNPESAPPMGIGRNCRIERCIIDKNVRIGDDVVIEAQPNVKEYEGQRRWIRDGITVIPKGTIIASGTRL